MKECLSYPPVYGFGYSEELVAKAMKNTTRNRYQILTKFGLNWESADGEFYFDSVDNNGKPLKIYKWSSKERVIKECEESLRRLRTDYIDLYQIHWPDSTTPISETFEAVQKLIEQGKVRAAGVCNYNTAQVNEALSTIQLASNQVPYSHIFRDIEKSIVPQALEKVFGIIVYSPLQRGLLTGKIKPGHHLNEGDTREGNRFYTEENIKRANQLLEEIKPIAEAHNATLAQVILKWTMYRPGVACVLAGARNEQQVVDNAKALHLSLSTEELNTKTTLSESFIKAEVKSGS
ncbi:aldo/keto reductase [Chitinophagaceae bacterium LB-8]|uniref:Aldo/keto reductase n=1 Tax=Paraflavisolibacter caeni TaxID=2982496 RepID=A0A9X3BHG4_9BACT|nr:aldo/keto reductase [Paraflavisolibacter caeni]MCU7552324.1 aldo/keto reductase [Paraflavisolibacter caeni]